MPCAGSAIFFGALYILAALNITLGTVLMQQADTAEVGSCCVPSSSNCSVDKYETWMDSSGEHRPRGITPLFGMCIFSPEDAEEIGCSGLSEMSRYCETSGSWINCRAETSTFYSGSLVDMWKGNGAILVALGSLQLAAMIFARSLRRATRADCNAVLSFFTVISVIILFAAVIMTGVAGISEGDAQSGITQRLYLIDTGLRHSLIGTTTTARASSHAVFSNLTQYGSIDFNKADQGCPFENQTASSLRYTLLPWPVRGIWIFLFVWTLLQFILMTTITSFACCDCGGMLACFDDKFEEWAEDIRALR